VAQADNAEDELSDDGEYVAESELAELGIQLGD
jgi:hypothetical protein